MRGSGIVLIVNVSRHLVTSVHHLGTALYHSSSVTSNVEYSEIWTRRIIVHDEFLGTRKGRTNGDLDGTAEGEESTAPNDQWVTATACLFHCCAVRVLGYACLAKMLANLRISTQRFQPDITIITETGSWQEYAISTTSSCMHVLRAHGQNGAGTNFSSRTHTWSTLYYTTLAVPSTSLKIVILYNSSIHQFSHGSVQYGPVLRAHTSALFAKASAY